MIRINDVGDPFTTRGAKMSGPLEPPSLEDLRRWVKLLPEDQVADVLVKIEGCETLQQSLPSDADWWVRAGVGRCTWAVQDEIVALLKANVSEVESGVEEEVVVPTPVEPVSTTGALVAAGGVAVLLVAFAV